MSGVLKFYTDGKRVVCLPYCRAELHNMARELGIKKGWNRRTHFEVPKKQAVDIMMRCNYVIDSVVTHIIEEHTLP